MISQAEKRTIAIQILPNKCSQTLRFGQLRLVPQMKKREITEDNFYEYFFRS